MAWFLVRAAVTAWLIAIAIGDLRTGRIPNRLTLPMMLLFGALRLAQTVVLWLGPRLGFANPDTSWLLSSKLPILVITSPSFVWFAWLFVFAMWNLHLMGGGDAKLLMGLFAVLARLDFAVVLAAGILLLGVPALVLKYKGVSVRALFAGGLNRLLTGRLLPTEQDLVEQGVPSAWLFCLPGVIYIWALW